MVVVHRQVLARSLARAIMSRCVVCGRQIALRTASAAAAATVGLSVQTTHDAPDTLLVKVLDGVRSTCLVLWSDRTAHDDSITSTLEHNADEQINRRK